MSLFFIAAQKFKNTNVPLKHCFNVFQNLFKIHVIAQVHVMQPLGYIHGK